MQNVCKIVKDNTFFIKLKSQIRRLLLIEMNALERWQVHFLLVTEQSKTWVIWVTTEGSESKLMQAFQEHS